MHEKCNTRVYKNSTGLGFLSHWCVAYRIINPVSSPLEQLVSFDHAGAN